MMYGHLNVTYGNDRCSTVQLKTSIHCSHMHYSSAAGMELGLIYLKHKDSNKQLSIIEFFEKKLLARRC